MSSCVQLLGLLLRLRHLLEFEARRFEWGRRRRRYEELIGLLGLLLIAHWDLELLGVSANQLGSKTI
jgi:hypothetical protein